MTHQSCHTIAHYEGRNKQIERVLHPMSMHVLYDLLSANRLFIQQHAVPAVCTNSRVWFQQAKTYKESPGPCLGSRPHHLPSSSGVAADFAELREALEKLGLPCTPQYLVGLMQEFDVNRGGHTLGVKGVHKGMHRHRAGVRVHNQWSRGGHALFDVNRGMQVGSWGYQRHGRWCTVGDQ